MSQTFADISLSTMDSIVTKQAYDQITNLTGGNKWNNFELLETWLRDSKLPLQHFRDMLKGLATQMREEKPIEIDREHEVILFCADQSLIKYLNLAEDLIKEHFITVQKINFTVECDPEIPDKWVIADVAVAGEIDQVLEWENGFIKDWVTFVPYPEREKIRLSCNII
jgi:hypothetical protein